LKKRGLNDSELELVLNDLDTTDDLRLKSIIYLFYFQGLRIGELNKLQVKNFNSDDMTLQIYGKSRDDYEVINLHPSSVETLNEYLKSEKLKSGYMFVSRSNNSLNKPLTTRSIRRMVDSFHRSLGFVLNPHSYRKTFTTKLVKSLPNLMDVMKFTRHRSIQMIQTYYDSLEKESLLPIYYESFQINK
jgi:integrase